MENLLEKLGSLGVLVVDTFSDFVRYLTDTQILGRPLIELVIGSGITITLGIIIANFFRE